MGLGWMVRDVEHITVLCQAKQGNVATLAMNDKICRYIDLKCQMTLWTRLVKYKVGKVTKFGPSSGVIPPSFEANPHCNCILEWLRNDGMGLEWQGWKFEWPLRRPPHPVILGPVQSFQGHPCHSSGMRAIVIPNHSRMTSEWWNDRMTLEWQNDFRMTEWL